MASHNLKYIIYARVSPKGSGTRDKETTVADQVARCRAWIDIHDGLITDVVTDEQKSGDMASLPGLQGILADVENDTAEWDCIIADSLDRILRSHLDMVKFCDRLNRADKGIVLLREHFDCSTAVGRFQLHIFSALAEFEREQTRMRTKAKMVAICKRGEWPVGRCPYGYKRTKATKNILQLDNPPAENVKAFFELYAGGMSINDISARYKGIPRTSYQNILHILRNRIYTGVIPYDGEEYDGKHEAIVSEELWQAANARLPGDSQSVRRNAQTYDYLLTGIIYCHCGKRMTAYSTHGRSSKYYYYRCTGNRNSCDAKAIPAKAIEDHIMDNIEHYPTSSKTIEAMVKAAHTEREHIRQRAAPRLEEINRAIGPLATTVNNLRRMFEQGLVSAENSASINQQLAEKQSLLESLQGRKDDLERAIAADLGPLEDVGTLLATLRASAAQMRQNRDRPDACREFIHANISRIDVSEDGIITISYRYTGLTKAMEWQPILKLVTPPIKVEYRYNFRAGNREWAKNRQSRAKAGRG